MFYPSPSPGLANKDPGLGSGGSSSWQRHTSFGLGGNNGGSGVPPPSPGYGINGYSFNHVVGGGGQGHGNQPSFGGGGGGTNGPGGGLGGHQGSSGLGHSMGHGGHQTGMHGHGHGMGGMGNGMGGQGNGAIGPGRGQQGGSPPMGRAEPSSFWQQQLVRAEACRQASTPHHRARASAMASRQQKNPLTILDPNRPPSSLSITHRKNTSMASSTLNNSVNGGNHLDRDDSSTDTGSPVPAPAHPSGTAAPVIQPAESDTTQPWQGIDLGGIRLKTLSSSLFAFTHITSLYINHNHLTSLSPAISQLRQLTHLDATGNQLSSVPPELGLVISLKELLLFDNNITDLPLELGTLHHLEFLGIEGNPISDSLRIAMSEKGTEGLIAYFLHNCPVMPAPPPRKWEIVDEDDGVDEVDNDDSFSLLCFNILGERFANTQTYPYTPSWALEWSYRTEAILEDMTSPGTDIICLQEVEDIHYHDFFLPKMTELGYEGVFSQKTRARTMTSDEKRFVDGSATFWRPEKFQLIEKQVVEYNQLALQKVDMRTDDMFNRIMRRDDIALVCTFENRTTDTRLIVANTHIVWDPQYRDVKLCQVAMLVEEVDKMATQFARFPPKHRPVEGDTTTRTYADATKVPMIICGDYNSIPQSGVYDFFTKGECPPDHEDFMNHNYGNFTTHGLKHRFHLRSAYDSIGELPLTNYTPTFQGPIDYIWYSSDLMSVTGLLGEVDKGYLAKIVGFPHPHFPSDHIPVAASFKMKPPTAAVNGNRYHR